MAANLCSAPLSCFLLSLSAEKTRGEVSMMCVPMLCMCVSGGAEVGGVTSSDVQQTETQPEEK